MRSPAFSENPVFGLPVASRWPPDGLPGKRPPRPSKRFLSSHALQGAFESWKEASEALREASQALREASQALREASPALREASQASREASLASREASPWPSKRRGFSGFQRLLLDSQ